jgi:hypothetical protein
LRLRQHSASTSPSFPSLSSVSPRPASWKKNDLTDHSHIKVQCLSWILDPWPEFQIPNPASMVEKIPDLDPNQHQRNLSIFNLNCY